MRAMYPESSSAAIIRNMIRMRGTKPSTPPTPSMTPETTRERVSPSGIRAVAVSPIQPNRASTQLMGISPTVKVIW